MAGAINTQNRIIGKGLENEFEAIIKEQYPEGLTDTQLNDLLRFDSKSIYKWLGIEEE